VERDSEVSPVIRRLTIEALEARLLLSGAPPDPGASDFQVDVLQVAYTDGAGRVIIDDFSQDTIDAGKVVTIDESAVTGRAAGEEGAIFEVAPVAGTPAISLNADTYVLGVGQPNPASPAIPVASITVDGNPADWTGVALHIQDTNTFEDDTTAAGSDIDTVQLAKSSDGNTLYVLIHTTAPVSQDVAYRLMFDNDRDGDVWSPGDTHIDVAFDGSSWALTSGGVDLDGSWIDVDEGGAVSVSGAYIELRVSVGALALPSNFILTVVSHDPDALDNDYDHAYGALLTQSGVVALASPNVYAGSTLTWQWSATVANFQNVDTAQVMYTVEIGGGRLEDQYDNNVTQTATLTVDGQASDWAGLVFSPVASEHASTGGSGADIVAVATAMDAAYGYVLIQTAGTFHADAEVMVILNFQPGAQFSRGPFDDLQLLIDGQNRLFAYTDFDQDGNWEDYELTDALVARGDVLEIRVALAELVDLGLPDYFNVTFANINATGTSEGDDPTWVDPVLSPKVQAMWFTGTYQGQTYDHALALLAMIESSVPGGPGWRMASPLILTSGVDPDTTVVSLRASVADGRTLTAEYALDGGAWQVLAQHTLPAGEMRSFPALFPYLRVQTASQPAIGPDEMNDTLATATPVTLMDGAWVRRQGEIGDNPYAANDVDFYKVVLYAGDIFRVRVDAACWGSPLDAVVSVWNAAGTRLAVSDNVSGSDPHLEMVAPADGLFYVAVTSAANQTFNPKVAGSAALGASTGRYEIAMKVTEALFAADEFQIDVGYIVYQDGSGRHIRDDFDNDLADDSGNVQVSDAAWLSRAAGEEGTLFGFAPVTGDAAARLVAGVYTAAIPQPGLSDAGGTFALTSADALGAASADWTWEVSITGFHNAEGAQRLYQVAIGGAGPTAMIVPEVWVSWFTGTSGGQTYNRALIIDARIEDSNPGGSQNWSTGSPIILTGYDPDTTTVDVRVSVQGGVTFIASYRVNGGAWHEIAQHTLTSGQMLSVPQRAPFIYMQSTLVPSGHPKAPTIGSLTDSPDPVTRPNALTLTARNVQDDGAVVLVEFYFDADDSGTLNPSLDLLLGVDRDPAGGWSLALPTGGAPTGALRLFARALDDDGNWSNVVTTVAHTVNQKPAVASVTAATSVVRVPNLLTLTANGVGDADGEVDRVEFYLDTNGNGRLDTGDLFLGVDDSAAGGWTCTVSTAGWPEGVRRFFAKAQDDDGEWSTVVSGTVRVTWTNLPPTLASVSAASNPVRSGTDVVITASGATDLDGVVARVEFYADLNGNGQIDVGVDLLLGWDADPSGGWSCTASTAGWAAGVKTVLARAQDNEGAWSDTVRGTLTVLPPPGVEIIGRHAVARKAGWYWIDENGDIVTPVFTGKTGYVRLIFTDETERTLDTIELVGTNLGTSLSFKVRPGGVGAPDGVFLLHQVVSDGAANLKTLNLAKAQWTSGGIDIQGVVRTLELGAVAAGTAFCFTALPTDVLTIVAGAVGLNVDLEFSGVLKSLTVTAWAGGSIGTAQDPLARVGTVTAKAGHFGADLTVGLGGIKALSVKGGDLSGNLTSAGPVGKVTVARNVLGLGGSLTGQLTAARFGAVALTGGNFLGALTSTASRADLGAGLAVKSVRVTGGTLGGTITAEGAVGPLTAVRNRAGAGGAVAADVTAARIGAVAAAGDFSGSLTNIASSSDLGGLLGIKSLTLKGGNLTGSVSAEGNVGPVSVTRTSAGGGNVAASARLTGDGTLKSLFAAGDFAGLVMVDGGLASFKVSGNLLPGARIAVNGRLGTFAVGGSLLGGTTEADLVQVYARAMGTVTIGGNVLNTRLIAATWLGEDWAIGGDDQDADEFFPPYAPPGASINRLTVHGNVTDSVIGAGIVTNAGGFDLDWCAADGFTDGCWINTIVIDGIVSVSTAGAESQFGLGAYSITSVTIKGGVGLPLVRTEV
jgi:hypothetical protein